MREKNSFPFVCLCLHLFRINNMQVVVIAVIVAHKQPSDYYNALCLTLPLPFFIRWIVFSSFLLNGCVSNGQWKWHGMTYHQIGSNRMSSTIPWYLRAFRLSLLLLQLITTLFYNVDLVLFPFSSLSFTCLLSLFYVPPRESRHALVFSFDLLAYCVM